MLLAVIRYGLPGKTLCQLRRQAVMSTVLLDCAQEDSYCPMRQARIESQRGGATAKEVTLAFSKDHLVEETDQKDGGILHAPFWCRLTIVLPVQV